MAQTSVGWCFFWIFGTKYVFYFAYGHRVVVPLNNYIFSEQFFSCFKDAVWISNLQTMSDEYWCRGIKKNLHLCRLYDIFDLIRFNYTRKNYSSFWLQITLWLKIVLHTFKKTIYLINQTYFWNLNCFFFC